MHFLCLGVDLIHCDILTIHHNALFCCILTASLSSNQHRIEWPRFHRPKKWKWASCMRGSILWSSMVRAPIPFDVAKNRRYSHNAIIFLSSDTISCRSLVKRSSKPLGSINTPPKQSRKDCLLPTKKIAKWSKGTTLSKASWLQNKRESTELWNWPSYRTFKCQWFANLATS